MSTRAFWGYDWYTEEDIKIPFTGKKDRILKHNPFDHVPSEHEGKVVRHLCAKHKMTEEEIRSVKKFRKVIADAVYKQNQPSRRYVSENKSRHQARYIISKASEEIGKHIMHPDTLLRAKEISMGNDRRRFDSHLYFDGKSDVTNYIIKLLNRTKPK